jgi:hypothetical protein
MRIITMLTALIALSTVAFAEDKKASNVHDNVTPDEQVTALIKRRMAYLLYPVDMSSLVPPDKDSKFRDLIAVLQQQMGDAPTGVLTTDEFARLTDASDNIDGVGLALGHKIVTVADNGNWVSASGPPTPQN